jgi:WD40 repeat protein
MFREPAPGTPFGRWRIERKLGQGGMGAVYAVRDAGGRQAALKLVLVQDPSFLERFNREAHAALTLKHDNICQTYEVLTEYGIPGIAMELLPGGSLADLVKTRGARPWPEVAALGAGIARGLAAIHTRGMVHRDLKPANILLDQQGRPKISDFGLIRSQGLAQAGAAQSLTKTGDVLGTYEYLAPEQAESAKVDYRADLYSLGVVLYELLSGKTPFVGQGYSLIRQHLTEKPRSLRSLGIPEALDRLVLRLLEKDPSARPETAADVARDLAEIVGKKETPPPSRKKGPLLVAALLVVAAGAGAALVHLTLGGAPEAPPPVAPAPKPPLTPPPPPVPAVWWANLPAPEKRFQERCAKALLPTAMTKVVAVRGHESMKHARDAHSLAFVKGSAGRPTVLLSVGYGEHFLHIWNPETGEDAHDPIPFQKGLRSVAVDPQGRRAVVGTSDSSSAVVFDTTTWRLISQRDMGWDEVAVGISSDGRFAAAGGGPWPGHLIWWPIDAEEENLRFETEKSPWWVRFVPGSSRQLVFGTAEDSKMHEGSVMWADLDGRTTHQFEPHSGGASTEGIFDGDGRVLSVGTDHVLRRQTTDGKVERSPADPEHAQQFLLALALSPDGRTIALGGGGGVVELHDGRSLERTDTIPLGTTVQAVAFHPDGKRLAVGCGDGAVRILDLATKADLLSPTGLETHTSAITAIAVSPDGKTLLTGSQDKTLRTWEVDEHGILHPKVEKTPSPAGGLAFLPGTTPLRFLEVRQDGSIRLRAIGSTDPLQEGRFDAYPAATLLAVAPDQRHVAVSGGWGHDGHILTMDSFQDMGVRLPTPATQSAVYAADFSRDGRRAVLCAPNPKEKNLFLVDLETRTLETPLDCDLGGHLSAAAFLDAAGNQVVVGTANGKVAVWDLQKMTKVEADLTVRVDKLLLLDSRIIALARATVFILDRGLKKLDAIDLGQLYDEATSGCVDPDRHDLWIGTGKGAILRFRVSL